MGFRTGAFAKCWSVEPGNGNFTKVRMSISRKNKETGEYEQDFSGFVMMIGHAHAKAQSLKNGDRIRLGDIDVTTKFDKAANKEYINYKCFEYTMADEDVPGQAPSGNVQSNPVEGDNDVEEEAPF